jgi:hypothetical protein
VCDPALRLARLIGLVHGAKLAASTLHSKLE